MNKFGRIEINSIRNTFHDKINVFAANENTERVMGFDRNKRYTATYKSSILTNQIENELPEKIVPASMSEPVVMDDSQSTVKPVNKPPNQYYLDEIIDSKKDKDSNLNWSKLQQYFIKNREKLLKAFNSADCKDLTDKDISTESLTLINPSKTDGETTKTVQFASPHGNKSSDKILLSIDTQKKSVDKSPEKGVRYVFPQNIPANEDKKEISYQDFVKNLENNGLRLCKDDSKILEVEIARHLIKGKEPIIDESYDNSSSNELKITLQNVCDVVGININHDNADQVGKYDKNHSVSDKVIRDNLFLVVVLEDKREKLLDGGIFNSAIKSQTKSCLPTYSTNLFVQSPEDNHNIVLNRRRYESVSLLWL